MTSTPNILRKAKSDLAKVEKMQSAHGKYDGFTIDISMGGNKETILDRITIGSVAGPEDSGQDFLSLVRENLKASVAFWENTAKGEIEQLQKAIDL